MKTQAEHARIGRTTPAMEAVAAEERVPATVVMAELAAGRAVLPFNPAHRNLEPAIAGIAFRTKVNANIGRSGGASGDGCELGKLRTALRAKADFIMDLSVGPRLAGLRRRMLAACPKPFGTVPIYEAIERVRGRAEALTAEGLLSVIESQARQGVDFMTLHAGLRLRDLPLAARRKAGIVSRGGALIARWMASHRRENPLYSRWNDVMDICRSHDVTVSLGDGLRPGCLADAGDRAQFSELDTLGELVRRCRGRGVQVMVEGPGHVPLNRIPAQVRREARVCGGAPFYVLGPVVTDVAAGYDHISAAIGAASAACHGAALLCYVTPAEHLGLPTSREIHEGVMAFRLAAHAGDVARGLPGARDWDDAMTEARIRFDWKRQFRIAMDGDRARRRYIQGRRAKAPGSDFCSMCGRDYCAIRNSKKLCEALDSRAGRG